MAAIAKTTPYMMVAKLICATAIFIVFYQSAAGWFLTYWTIAIYIIAALSLNHVYQNRERGTVFTASTKAVVLSGLWGISF